MKKAGEEFDAFAPSYDERLKDPLRDRFTGGEPGFFHARKRDLIRSYLESRNRHARALDYLDVGCGRGELLGLLAGDFRRAAGCDPSAEMLAALDGTPAETRLQNDSGRVPFDDGSFDLVTAVCVYHHVPPAGRAALTREVTRVLRPGGIFCMIEHNPWNPITRAVVTRTPVDADAILLAPDEGRKLMRQADLTIDAQEFFLFFPAAVYRRIGALERLLTRLPLGGQYATFGRL